MALPICIEIPEIPDPFSITLPGGVSMESINLMEQIQPALTPLMPLFDIIDTVVAVFNCIKAIPDTLGPPPDPTVLAACIPELAEKVAKLLKLIPQLSLPFPGQFHTLDQLKRRLPSRRAIEVIHLLEARSEPGVHRLC